MIIIEDIYLSIPDSLKYKELKQIYYYISLGSYTLFKHMDRILEKGTRNWEIFRRNKAEFLAKKMKKVFDL